MREILFRGKRVDNGEWVYGDLVNCSAYSIIYEPRRWDEPVQCYEVISETVGQYIGLEDCTGRKIFEGDILRYCPERNDKFVYRACDVRYGNFNCSCCDGVYGWYLEDGDIRSIQKDKIVGNIHDNPELLEVKE